MIDPCDRPEDFILLQVFAHAVQQRGEVMHGDVVGQSSSQRLQSDQIGALTIGSLGIDWEAL